MSDLSVTRTFPVQARGTGRPDYTEETHRGKELWGYIPEPDETFFFAIIIALETPGAYPFTRVGINPGETVELIDAFTGLPGVTPPAGWDYIIKEFWITFDQPMRYQMISEVSADSCCEVPVPPFKHTEMVGFPVGWTRAQTEPIDAETTTRCQVTNLGTELAYGKAWVVGFMKEGIYTWY